MEVYYWNVYTYPNRHNDSIIKNINIKTSKQLLYKLCFTVEQPLIHETAGLFPVKIEKKTRVVLF
jgi:hypothetical protein